MNARTEYLEAHQWVRRTYAASDRKLSQAAFRQCFSEIRFAAPKCPGVWRAAVQAVSRRTATDETHGVMRWAPEGRADRQMVRAEFRRLRQGGRAKRARLPA